MEKILEECYKNRHNIFDLMSMQHNYGVLCVASMNSKFACIRNLPWQQGTDRPVTNWLSTNQLLGQIHTHTQRHTADFSGTAVNKSPRNIHTHQHTHLARWIDWFMSASQHILVTAAAMWVWECWQLYVSLVTHIQLRILEVSDNIVCVCLCVCVWACQNLYLWFTFEVKTLIDVS